jgi:hypothetical protein
MERAGLVPSSQSVSLAFGTLMPGLYQHHVAKPVLNSKHHTSEQDAAWIRIFYGCKAEHNTLAASSMFPL